MGRFTVTHFLHEQWKKLPYPSLEDAKDIGSKSLILVGANVGLGFEAALHFTRLRPSQLLLTCRNTEKCEATINCTIITDNNISTHLNHISQAIQQHLYFSENHSVSDSVSSWPLQLDSFDSVRAFVDRFESEGRSLDVLVANAGIDTFEYSRTQDGWETTLQVNYLATALLSLLLLPHLIKSVNVTEEAPPARLIIITSELHFLAQTDRLRDAHQWSNILEVLSSEAFCSPSAMRRRYHLTKFLEIIFVRELTRRLPSGPSRLSICAVNPGFCKSQIFRHFNYFPLRQLISVGLTCFARSTEVGSRTLVHAAVASGERERHGHYISSCIVEEESDWVFTKDGREFSDRIWAETIEYLGQVDSRVHDIVSKYLVDPGV